MNDSINKFLSTFYAYPGFHKLLEKQQGKSLSGYFTYSIIEGKLLCLLSEDFTDRFHDPKKR
jgi:hypothetical protein